MECQEAIVQLLRHRPDLQQSKVPQSAYIRTSSVAAESWSGGGSAVIAVSRSGSYAPIAFSTFTLPPPCCLRRTCAFLPPRSLQFEQATLPTHSIPAPAMGASSIKRSLGVELTNTIHQVRMFPRLGLGARQVAGPLTLTSIYRYLGIGLTLPLLSSRVCCL